MSESAQKGKPVSQVVVIIMNFATPEQMGVHSSDIKAWLKTIENSNLAVHDLIIARGNNIIFEFYAKPFHKDFLHRLYSVTKSYVSIAIGFCEQDGLLNLDEKICDLFPKETADVTDPYVLKQTVRNMLMMSTAKRNGNFFLQLTDDRVHQYFHNPNPSREPGQIFEYDSAGSFVLGALVERLTGKRLLEYLREKCLDKIGFSKEAYMMTCPGGHSWGDSALMATARDLLLTARFVMNGGSWNGEQLLNENYMRTATSKLIENHYAAKNEFESFGYGYQFWKTYHDGYLFNGMGGQLAYCLPHKDMILITNCDVQGNPDGKAIIIENYMDLIVNNAADPLPESDSHRELMAYADTYTLAEAAGAPYSRLEKQINNVKYVLDENPMGITEFTFSFDRTGGTFDYINAQGKKSFRIGRKGYGNAYGIFPQDNCCDEVGSVPVPGHKYKCGASFAWANNNTLSMRVQIIDKYFGNFIGTFTFEDDKVSVEMVKAAEAFLLEYEGTASGKKA